MKLNVDCVRDILLVVEEYTDHLHSIKFYDPSAPNARETLLFKGVPKYNQELFDKYTEDVVIYHVEYCFKAELIEEDKEANEPYIGVSDLTPRGHEVLNDIREKTVFEKAKAIAKNLGVGSVSSIQKIVSNVATNLINDYFIR